MLLEQRTEASAGHAGEEEPLRARGQPPWYWARGVRAWTAGRAKILASVPVRRENAKKTVGVRSDVIMSKYLVWEGDHDEQLPSIIYPGSKGYKLLRSFATVGL
jgi:hypothetical protein